MNTKLYDNIKANICKLSEHSQEAAKLLLSQLDKATEDDFTTSELIDLLKVDNNAASKYFPPTSDQYLAARRIQERIIIGFGRDRVVMKYKLKLVSEATAEELLFELISRIDTSSAPTKIQLHGKWQDGIIGIGVDNTARILISDEDKQALFDVIISGEVNETNNDNS